MICRIFIAPTLHQVCRLESRVGKRRIRSLHFARSLTVRISERVCGKRGIFSSFAIPTREAVEWRDHYRKLILFQAMDPLAHELVIGQLQNVEQQLRAQHASHEQLHRVMEVCIGITVPGQGISCLNP